MKELTIALCDDDPVFRRAMAEALVHCFAAHGTAVQIEESGSARELLLLLGHRSADLLFLDIDMPQTDGIDLGRRLRELGCTADIIYVSNLDERVYEIFSVHPWSYIRKSRFSQELPAVIGEYVQTLRQRVGQIMLQDIEGQVRVFGPEDILYVEAAGKIQKLLLGSEPQPFLVRIALHDLEQQMTPLGFIRVHKGFLVNYRCIRKITSRSVTLDSGLELPIGRDRLKQARENYLALMKWKGLTPGANTASQEVISHD